MGGFFWVFSAGEAAPCGERGARRPWEGWRDAGRGGVGRDLPGAACLCREWSSVDLWVPLQTLKRERLSFPVTELPSSPRQGAEGGGVFFFFKSLRAAAFSLRERVWGPGRSRGSLLGGGRAGAGRASRSEGSELLLPGSSRSSRVCPLDSLVTLLC